MQKKNQKNNEHPKKCSNCQTKKTPLWRRGADGAYLCNACGLYTKIHKKNRPVGFKTENFKHRRRNKKDTHQKSFMTPMTNNNLYHKKLSYDEEGHNPNYQNDDFIFHHRDHQYSRSNQLINPNLYGINYNNDYLDQNIKHYKIQINSNLYRSNLDKNQTKLKFHLPEDQQPQNDTTEDEETKEAVDALINFINILK